LAPGAWDRRILDWLAGHLDTPTFLAVLGIVERATATAAPASTAQVRVVDPGGSHLAFTWHARDGHGHQASGQLAGAPAEPELAGWRYQAFAEAAEAAIAALKQLEGLAADHRPAPADPAAAESSPRRLVCDFCAERTAAYRYPTRRAGMVRIGGAVVVLPGGDWLACLTCQLLVEAGQWASLSTRAGLSAEQGAALWACFRACRGGPAVPLDWSQGGEVE
jgi:hypothetical protein